MQKSVSAGVPGFWTARRWRCVRRFFVSAAISSPLLFAHAADPSALPSGGSVAAGSASISQAGTRLTVQQQSNRAIVNWNSFNVGSNASVNFQQPGATSVILNRVASGGGVSEIYGSLTANGQVFLVNPAGTLFGRGAQVNVGGLVASSLDISNENFLGGHYRFAANGTAGSILNQGTLSAAAGGYIALLAPQVRNEGVIAAQLGTVAIGAGNAVTLDIGATGLVAMQVEQSAVDALVENRGLVQADGGAVYMSARAAGQVAGGVINNSGEIHAARVTERDGVIRLEAGDVANSGAVIADGASGGQISFVAGNTAINSGTLSARGSQAKGGEIRMLGDKVGLFGAGSADASGEAGGGVVLLGGNFQGRGPEQNASMTFIGPNASIRANAGATGNGGKVIVWSDDYTVFAGTLEAKGGTVSGNGGFAEISGKHALDFAPRSIDMKAPGGSVGSLLLDPTDIIVAAGGGAVYTDVSTFAASGGTQTIDPGVLDAVGGNVNLQATNDITVNNAINLTTLGAGLDAKAGNNIDVNASITTNNGAITLNARNAGGTQTASGTVTLSAALNSGGAAITLTNNASTLPISVGAAIDAIGGLVSFSDPTVLTASSTVTGNGGILFSGLLNGAFSLTANSTGTTTFASAVGGTTALTSLTTDAGGTTAINGSSVTTTGAQTYGDNVSLGAATTLASTGGGNITLGGTVNGAFALTVNTSGITAFNGSVGSTTPLASLTTDAPGSTAINGGFIASTGAQLYGDAVTLGAATTLSSGGNNITLGSTVNGAQTLAVNTTGTTTFAGAVGNTTALTSLTTNFGGTTAINGGSVTTTGAQTYLDSVTLGAATTLTGVGTTFQGTVNGPGALTVNDSGTVNFDFAVGGSTALASLTTNAGGSTAINGGFVATTGAQLYGDAVTLGAATTLSSGGNSITLGSIVNGAQSLAVNTSGATTFSGAVGAVTALTSLTTNAGGTTAINGGAIVTTGAQTYNDNVTLGAATTVSSTGAGSVTFGGTVNGAQALSVTTSGATTFSGAVGNTTALASLTTNPFGSTTFNGGSVTTSGAQTYSDSVFVNGTSTNIASTSGSITINSGLNAGSNTLSLSAGGDIRIVASSGSSNSVLAGNMNLTAGNDLLIQGGTGTNAFASASGSQTVNASTVSIFAGSVGSGNGAALTSVGNQTITASSGITIKGGPSGGSLNFGNRGLISSAGNQTVTVGAGGITLTGGGGGIGNTDNAALLLQTGLTSSQAITVNNGGSIVITGGSSGLSGVGGSGHGSRAILESDGTSQSINFTSGGSIILTGGTAGSRAFAMITSQNGSQTITGSPTITLTGGASGGIDDEGNFAQIFAKAAQSITAGTISLRGGAAGYDNNAGIYTDTGLQTITAGNVTLVAGAGGNENSAFIQGPSQNITVRGNLSLTGGGSINGSDSGGGAGLGGRGGTSATSTNLALTVDGDLTMTGGSVSGSSIGSGFTGGQATDMTITAGGNVTLNPGSAVGVRIGTPASSIAAGNISITAGGAIALNDSSTAGTEIRTLGNVTLKGASISEGTNGKSRITASALTTTSTSGATALNTLAIASLNATSAGALNLGQGAISGALVATSNGAVTETGPLTVGGTTGISAGAAPITLTAANDFQGVVTLSNSGSGNPVTVIDVNTITFTNQVLGGAFTVNAPTIIAHDTTNTGNQVWNGNVTFNSTETTNGGNFTVTGTTTLGNGLAVNAGAGNVTFQGDVNGTKSLLVNNSGTRTFGGTVASGVSLTFTGLASDSQGNSVTSSAQSTQSTQSALAVATISSGTTATSPFSSASTTSSSTSPSSREVAAAAAFGGGSIAPLTAGAASDGGTTRLTAGSGASKETIRQIDQQIQQARTQMFSQALTQLAKDSALADVPDCSGAAQGTCVKEGKAKKSALIAGDAEPVIKRRLAVLFGNDRYLAPIPALQTPIHDVEDIAKVLKDRLGYEVRVVRNASRQDIVNELNNLVTEVDADDSVFVYYAGHGYQAEKGGGGYWIPVDANNNDASTWISNGAISKFLANMASRQVMLISDSCYSGTLAQELKVQSSESTVFDRKEILRKRSVLVMSSGGNEPVSDGGHDNHSLFAFHLLRNLNAIDGDLVGGDIHEKVRTAVAKEYPQDPQYGAVVSAGHAAGGEYLIEKK